MDDNLHPANTRQMDREQRGKLRYEYATLPYALLAVLTALLLGTLAAAPEQGLAFKIPDNQRFEDSQTSKPNTTGIDEGGNNSTPILVHGTEQSRINMGLPDGGLIPVPGAYNVQVHRSTRGQTKLADGVDWTYKHQVDLAVWKGRMYAVWAMGRVNEIEPEYRLVYSTSPDGFHWSPPADLFPQEIVWYCRFYFYRAANGRMLAFCPYRSPNPKSFFPKNLLVREITSDHRLGQIFALINLDGGIPDQWAPFTYSKDEGFVAACREAAANKPLLEQQDLGVLLGDERIPWHGNTPDVSGWKFGKAFSFYHRADHALIGLCKMGYATVSEDNGKTWSQPVIPPTLFAGAAKIWGQRTADGRFALVYNPAPDHLKRWPLALVHGDDGREFRDMRIVHGEVPRQRYEGGHKDIGAQYVRGLAEWADDGTFADRQAMWLIYSVNKEDIWTARVPIPVKPDEKGFPSDDFEQARSSGIIPGWNVYSPLWAPVTLVADDARRCMELRDGDPFDYARAVRVFPETPHVRVELAVKASQTSGRLEIDLCDAGGRRPARVSLTETGSIHAAGGDRLQEVGKYARDAWTTIVITADLRAGSYTVRLNGGPAHQVDLAEQRCATLQRLSLRTGQWRGREGTAPVDPALDVPMANPAVFRIDRASIQPLAAGRE